MAEPTIKDMDHWLIHENTIKVDNTINTSNLSRVAELKSTYPDLVSLFGEPINIKDSKNKRVQWGFLEVETGVIATIYDDNEGIWTPKDRPLNEIYTWEVGGLTNLKDRMKNRSFEIVAQAFVQMQSEGKKLVSKPLQEDLDNFNKPKVHTKNPFEDGE